jgi:hypothetical protein
VRLDDGYPTVSACLSLNGLIGEMGGPATRLLRVTSNKNINNN